MKKKLVVRASLAEDGRVVLRLETGAAAESSFRRVCAPFGLRAQMTDGSYSSRTYYVPVERAMECCKALLREGFSVLAGDAIQQRVKLAQFQCTVMKLYPHQKTGAEFLRSRRRAILADQMGVGKTPAALASLDAHKGVLVICPAVMVGTWYQESRRWRPDIRPVVWDRPYGIFPDVGELVIASYSRLPSEHVEERSRCPWCSKLSVIALERKGGGDVGGGGSGGKWTHVCDQQRGGCGRSFNQKEDAWTEGVWAGPLPRVPVQLVLDEAHYCKTPKSKRATVVRALAARSERVSMLTGTPLLNDPSELWALCSIFPGQGQFDSGAHAVFGSKTRFAQLFHGKKNHWGGWEWRDEPPDPEASKLLGSIVLRRTRAEVLPDLPSKTRRFIDCDVELGRGERGALADWDAELRSMDDEEVLAACAEPGSLSSMRAELAEKKLQSLLEIIAEYEMAREPVVVFSYHRAPIEQLGSRRGWGKIVGGTPALDRTQIVAAFQARRLTGIAGTIGAMGVGVTLTQGAAVLFLDRDFVLANNLQAEDRCCRIGQNRGVVVTILRARHPVDERVEAILERKERMLAGMQLAEEPQVEAGVSA